MKKVMAELLRIVDAQVASIIDHISTGNVFVSETFDGPVITSESPERGSPLRGRKGVYVFVLTGDISLTHEDIRKWCSKCTGAPFLFWNPRELHAGECLYVGSAIKSLYSRIRRHISGKGEYSSLNLSAPTRQILKPIIKVYAFPIKKKFSDEMIRMILPAIEKRLHQHLHPITGQSRV